MFALPRESTSGSDAYANPYFPRQACARNLHTSGPQWFRVTAEAFSVIFAAHGAASFMFLVGPL